VIALDIATACNVSGLDPDHAALACEINAVLNI
jgi:hypothetical protein